jgi:hypothetical protein
MARVLAALISLIGNVASIGEGCDLTDTCADSSSIMLLQSSISKDFVGYPPIGVASNQAWNTTFSTYVFHHIGKTAGGTVEHRADMLELDLVKCHPLPYDCYMSKGGFVPPSAVDLLPHALVSVRDPVDRFESAFNWRCIEVCEPNETDRIQVQVPSNYTSKPSEEPDSFCKRLPTESHILNVKYSRNVSMLAEALCSNDTKIRQEANSDVLRIGGGHMVPLSYWMQLGKWKQRKRVAAVARRRF